MKHAILGLLLLCSSGAFASGRFILEPKLNTDTGTVLPTLGLATYEKLGAGTYLNSWLGMGGHDYDSRPKVTWYGAKTALEWPVFNWAVVFGLGFETGYVDPYGEWNSAVFGKVAVKLW